MTTFWSWYITILTGGTLVGLTWLIFATRKGQRKDTTEETLDHAFDGIQEFDNPLPKWWFMLFVGTLVFGVGYLLLYPGMGNWKGLLPGYQDATSFKSGEKGWTGVHQWEKEMAKADEQYGPIFAKYAAMPIEEVAKDEQALKMGGRLFAFVGEAPLMTAQLITHVAEGKFRTESLFENLVPTMRNAPQKSQFKF